MKDKTIKALKLLVDTDDFDNWKLAINLALACDEVYLWNLYWLFQTRIIELRPCCSYKGLNFRIFKEQFILDYAIKYLFTEEQIKQNSKYRNHLLFSSDLLPLCWDKLFDEVKAIKRKCFCKYYK